MARHFQDFQRITTDPKILGGKPCVRGLRLSVQRVLEVLSDNPSWEELQLDYPELTRDDIREVLAFAAASLNEYFLPMDTSAA